MQNSANRCKLRLVEMIDIELFTYFLVTHFLGHRIGHQNMEKSSEFHGLPENKKA